MKGGVWSRFLYSIGLALLALSFASAAHALPTVCQIANGCLGTSTVPSYGNVLIGGKNGEYEYVASSTLGGGGGAVTSVFGRTGAVTAQNGDYTTSLIPEGTNLYWTQGRFDNALSATTSLPNILTLSGLSLPYSQLTGTPAIPSFPLSVANGGTGSTTLTGLLKGNGTGGVLTAVGDNDYQKPISLTTNGTSGAATFSGDTLNIPQYTAPAYSASFPVTLSGSTFGFAGLSTSTNGVVGNIPYFSGVNTFANVGTSSLGITGPITFSGTLGSQIGGAGGNFGCTTAASGVTGCLSGTDWNTFNNKQAAISATYPITFSANTVGFSGLATSSPWTAGNLAEVSNNNTVFGVGTTSISCGTYVTCTGFNALGSASTIALNGTLNANQVLYTNNAGNAIATVATSTLSATSPLTGSFTQVGSGGSLGCQTASGSQAGCLSSTDWSTFNNKDSFAWPFTIPADKQSATTSLMLLYGNASTTQFTATSSVWLATSAGSVGIGTTSPQQALDVQGNIDFPGNNALYIGNNLALYASSTNADTVIGLNAGTNDNASSTWADETCIGFQACNGTIANTTNPGLNTAIGYQALQNRTSGFKNVAIGAQAGSANTSGQFNVAIGWHALNANQSQSFSTAVGEEADSNATGASDDAFGSGACQGIGAGSDNTCIGTGDLLSANGNSHDNTILGFHTAFRVNSNQSWNIVIGSQALGNQNTNRAVGNNNLVIGGTAAQNEDATTFQNNVILGVNAGVGAAGSYASQGLTMTGYQSGNALATSSDYNTFYGYQSGIDVSSGNDNILIGPELNTGGSHLTTGQNDICIGFNCILSGGTGANNQLNIGNFIFGTNFTATSSGTTIPSTLSGYLGLSTTTPSMGVLTVASSTAPQIALSDANGSNLWTERNINGNYYLATSTYTATSTPATLSIVSGQVAIASTTYVGQLTLGTTGSTNGTSTVAAGKLQWDGYNAAGTRVCVFVVGTTLTVISGACKQ